MKTKKVTGEEGFVEFRLPSYPEKIRLMAKMGLGSEDFSEENIKKIQEGKSKEKDFLKGKNILLVMADLIESLEPFITKVEVKGEEGELTSYKDLLYDEVGFHFLTMVSNKLFEVMAGDKLKEKKP